MLEEAVDEAIHGGGAGLEQACSEVRYWKVT